jgi:hypothetical protein
MSDSIPIHADAPDQAETNEWLVRHDAYHGDAEIEERLTRHSPVGNSLGIHGCSCQPGFYGELCAHDWSAPSECRPTIVDTLASQADANGVHPISLL